MEIIRGLHNLRAKHHGCVATIGNFDGVHIGHQNILKQLKIKAEEYQLPAVVIIFEPQPMEFFRKDNHPARLTRFRDKAEVIRVRGIERLQVIRFNKTFSQLSADDFVAKFLVEKLGVKFLLVGDDFCYGKGRQGNFETLSEQSKKFGFEIANTPTFEYDAERVSSTRVRQALESGNMELTSTLLGRAYWMSGHIQHGHKRGRTIGFPTANVPLHRDTPAVSGVFAVRLWGKDLDGCEEPIMDENSRCGINGIANIGFRPTVDGTKGLLEVHLFDYNGDLYGKLVHVDFLHKIREEQKFDSFELLKQQIQEDVKVARKYFQQ